MTTTSTRLIAAKSGISSRLDKLVVLEEGTDRILGAHILGSEAGEVVNLFALGIRSGMRATDLKHMLFAYPTSGSNMTRML